MTFSSKSFCKIDGSMTILNENVFRNNFSVVSPSRFSIYYLSDKVQNVAVRQIESARLNIINKYIATYSKLESLYLKGLQPWVTGKDIVLSENVSHVCCIFVKIYVYQYDKEMLTSTCQCGVIFMRTFLRTGLYSNRCDDDNHNN